MAPTLSGKLTDPSDVSDPEEELKPYAKTFLPSTAYTVVASGLKEIIEGFPAMELPVSVSVSWMRSMAAITVLLMDWSLRNK
jgi:hypothetical protein